MIQHEDSGTMLGTLVINSDDEDVGTMKSKNLQTSWYRSGPEGPVWFPVWFPVWSGVSSRGRSGAAMRFLWRRSALEQQFKRNVWEPPCLSADS